MKYLIGSVVFIMLFVLPLGSWYYLQSGLDYRKDALKELEPKGTFTSEVINPETMQSKTTLLHTRPLEASVITKIFSQYEGSQTFQLMSIETPEQAADNWIQLSASEAEIISAAYNNAGLILVDTSMQLRNTYAADMDGVRRAIEHISIVLPRIKEMDVKMRKK